ncbi:Uncharacterised protein [Salmonella enterica subsp. enterica]|nr:Uncharacterised protein [Salmonella enterica subsp. enterica]
MVFLRPGQQSFVSGSRQRAGNDANLIGRRHAQAVFLFHGQIQPFHQLIHHATAAMNNHQRTLMGLTIVDQRGKKTFQSLFAIQ